MSWERAVWSLKRPIFMAVDYFSSFTGFPTQFLSEKDGGPLSRVEFSIAFCILFCLSLSAASLRYLIFSAVTPGVVGSCIVPVILAALLANLKRVTRASLQVVSVLCGLLGGASMWYSFDLFSITAFVSVVSSAYFSVLLYGITLISLSRVPSANPPCSRK